jgi:hypothetical protein
LIAIFASLLLSAIGRVLMGPNYDLPNKVALSGTLKTILLKKFAILALRSVTAVEKIVT